MPRPEAGPDTPLRVNRAPVLTLWAAVVAERLGHPADTALSLASHVAGTAARAKARRLGIAESHPEEGRAPLAPRHETVRLLGRDVPVVRDAAGTLLAASGGEAPTPAAPARAYVAKAFGPRLDEARAAMEALAASLDPERLNREGFRLYEGFRPEVPPDARGWGVKGELHLRRIREAAG